MVIFNVQLFPHLINPVSSLRILKIEDGKGVGLGEGVHVREVPARDGQLHRGWREGADWLGHLDLVDICSDKTGSITTFKSFQLFWNTVLFVWTTRSSEFEKAFMSARLLQEMVNSTMLSELSTSDVTSGSS